MTNNKIPNPFEKEDWFSNIVWQDKNTRIKAKQSFSKFLKQHSTYTFFMSLKDSYTTIVNSITKHSITATFIMLLALGGVGASAAELVAPEEFKPSTIIQKTFNPDFKENKVPDKDPFTALKPDTEYDVVNFLECDLSIKYPKQIDDQEILVNYGTTLGATQAGNNPIAGVSVNSFDVECYNKNDLKPIEKTDNGSNLSQKISSLLTTPKVYADSEDPSNVILKPLTAKEFYDMTNWFIFEGEITDIYEIANFDEFKIPEYKDNQKYVRFTHKDKTYFTYFETTKIERSGGSQNLVFKKPIEAKQLQLQFNSLVPSEANAKIVGDINLDKNAAKRKSISANFKYLSALLEDGGNSWTLFLSYEDKVYMLKNVQQESIFGQAINSTNNDNLIFTITGNVMEKKQAISMMEGTPDQKVDYEFTALNNAVLVGKASSTTSTASSTTSTAATTTYTNPFFPGLKVVYDNSWKFETKTYGFYKGLLKRDIKLTKNNKVLEFKISPVLPFGGDPIFLADPDTCQPGSSEEDLVKKGALKITTLTNGIKKYVPKTNCKDGWELNHNKVFYGDLNDFSFVLKSNIKATDVGYEYAQADGLVRYRILQIGGMDASDPFVSEIDQIISQSTFK